MAYMPFSRGKFHLWNFKKWIRFTVSQLAFSLASTALLPATLPQMLVRMHWFHLEDTCNSTVM